MRGLFTHAKMNHSIEGAPLMRLMGPYFCLSEATGSSMGPGLCFRSESYDQMGQRICWAWFTEMQLFVCVRR